MALTMRSMKAMKTMKGMKEAPEGDDAAETEAKKFFRVIDLPHLGMNLKKGQVYSLQDLHRKCRHDKAKLRLLKQTLKKPKVFQPATKAMKAMQAMKVSVIDKGSRAKRSVLKGTKKKTQSGLTKADLKKNKRGKIVSKKASANGLNESKNSWIEAVAKAREELGIEGFCCVGGNTEQGEALYATAMSIYKWRYTD